MAAGAVLLGCTKKVNGVAFIVDPSNKVITKLALLDVLIFSESDFLNFARPIFIEGEDSLRYWDSVASEVMNYFQIPPDNINSVCGLRWGFHRDDSVREVISSQFGASGLDRLMDFCWNSYKVSYYSEPQFFLESLFITSIPPEPKIRLKTDIDGAFSIKLPQGGNYVLIAESLIEGSDSKTHAYRWVIWLDGSVKGPSNLTNDNTFSFDDLQRLRKRLPEYHL